MGRIIAVLLIFAIMGALTSVMVWWIRGNRELHRRRRFKELRARKAQFRRYLGWALVGVLLALVLGTFVYYGATGGVLGGGP